MTDLSDLSTDNTPTSPRKRRKARARPRKRRAARARPRIPLPDGDVLEPRQQFAAEVGFTDRTARKLNLPTTYIGNVAYVKRNASLEILGARAQRRNEPYVGRRPDRKSATT